MLPSTVLCCRPPPKKWPWYWFVWSSNSTHYIYDNPAFLINVDLYFFIVTGDFHGKTTSGSSKAFFPEKNRDIPSSRKSTDGSSWPESLKMFDRYIHWQLMMMMMMINITHKSGLWTPDAKMFEPSRDFKWECNRMCFQQMHTFCWQIHTFMLMKLKSPCSLRAKSFPWFIQHPHSAEKNWGFNSLRPRWRTRTWTPWRGRNLGSMCSWRVVPVGPTVDEDLIIKVEFKPPNLSWKKHSYSGFT